MRVKLSKRLLIILFAALVVIGTYMFIEPYWIQVKKMVIVDEDIPAAFEDTRIVFVADIHHGPYFSRDRIVGLVRRINKLKPDIVLLGGDYVHRGSEYIKACFDELGKLQAGKGVYAVLGNHDHWENAELIRQCMDDKGIVRLDNYSLWIYKNMERIKLGGVGDLWCDSQDIDATVNDVSESDFVILLSHNPDYVEEMNSTDVDLVLSGHTHGGQVTLFNLWAPILPTNTGQKYRTGLIDVGYTQVLVSNGVGTITPPVRFFARPQINVIHLKRGR